jgi:hypothetical protein
VGPRYVYLSRRGHEGRLPFTFPVYRTLDLTVGTIAPCNSYGRGAHDAGTRGASGWRERYPFYTEVTDRVQMCWSGSPQTLR